MHLLYMLFEKQGVLNI